MHKALALLVVLIAVSFLLLPAVSAQEENIMKQGLKLLGAGLAVGLAAVGAGIAIGYSGAASIAVVAEKPGMRAWSFVILGLSEALAIYGLAIAFILIFTA